MVRPEMSLHINSLDLLMIAPQGVAAARILQRMARRCTRCIEQEASCIYSGNPHYAPRPRKVSAFKTMHARSLIFSKCLERERSQLFVCPQEIAVQTAHSRSHQGDHSAVQRQRCLPSSVHGWCCPSYAYINMQVCIVSSRMFALLTSSGQILPPVPEHPQTGQHPVHVRASQHDARPPHPAQQGPRATQTPRPWSARDGRERRTTGCSVVRQIHETLRNGARVLRGRSEAQLSEWAGERCGW
jgi:hypothetical protein